MNRKTRAELIAIIEDHRLYQEATLHTISDLITELQEANERIEKAQGDHAFNALQLCHALNAIENLSRFLDKLPAAKESSQFSSE